MSVEQVRRRIEQELRATRAEVERLDELIKLKGDYRRVEEGTHGVCEACGQAIEPERLAALPIAT